jgi:hypothetical protein
MSMNLVLSDRFSRCEFLCLTPTDITYEALKSRDPFEIYEQWYRSTFSLTPLSRKDRRNPYLLQQMAEAQQEIEKHIAAVRHYLMKHPNAKWSII